MWIKTAEGWRTFECTVTISVPTVEQSYFPKDWSCGNPIKYQDRNDYAPMVDSVLPSRWY